MHFRIFNYYCLVMINCSMIVYIDPKIESYHAKIVESFAKFVSKLKLKASDLWFYKVYISRASKKERWVSHVNLKVKALRHFEICATYLTSLDLCVSSSRFRKKCRFWIFIIVTLAYIVFAKNINNLKWLLRLNERG